MTLEDGVSQFSVQPAGVLRRTLDVRSYGFLALILLFAFALRLSWMIKMSPVISGEAEYVRVAENLRAGHGLTSSYGGPETMYAPLYSILSAGVSLLAQNTELAAHLVALIFGTLLIVPCFFITLRIYNLRVAYLSALLIAVHPLLIARSGSIYSEAVYPALLMGALYWGIRSLELHDAKHYLLCGLFFGLAYLTRPEAFAYPAFFAFALFALALLTRKTALTAIVAPALVLAGFFLIAFPYILFLHAHTGQWRLEGKWNINYTLGMRVHSGENDWQASYGLDAHQQEVGPLLDPERFARFTPYPHTWRDKLGYMLVSARLNRQAAYETLLSTIVGEPFLLILMSIGLFRHAWSPQRAIHEFVLGTMVLSILVLIFTAQHVELRYADPFLVLTVPWVAKGLEELGDWARSLAGSLGPLFARKTLLIGAAAQVAICIPMLALSFADTQSLPEFSTEGSKFLPVKEAGLWLKDQKPPIKRVAALNSVVPFYSSSILVQFPYAQPDQTLQYLDSQKVNFIVLEGRFSKYFPTIQEWLSHPIHDTRARLLYDSGGPVDSRVEIYSWQSTRASGAAP